MLSLTKYLNPSVSQRFLSSFIGKFRLTGEKKLLTCANLHRSNLEHNYQSINHLKWLQNDKLFKSSQSSSTQVLKLTLIQAFNSTSIDLADRKEIKTIDRHEPMEIDRLIGERLTLVNPISRILWMEISVTSRITLVSIINLSISTLARISSVKDLDSIFSTRFRTKMTSRSICTIESILLTVIVSKYNYRRKRIEHTSNHWSN